MQNELVTTENNFGYFSHGGFELSQRVAKMICASTIVPEAFRGNHNLGNAVIALNMAKRMDADPLMVMQNLYIVHGNPAWSSKFLIATFNSCGRYSAIRYEFSGEPGSKEWGCRAVTTERETGEKLCGPLITIGLAEKEGWLKKNGSKWQTMPELMLRYRAAAWLVKTVAPEIAMGLGTADEEEDAYVSRTWNTPAVVQDAEPKKSLADFLPKKNYAETEPDAEVIDAESEAENVFEVINESESLMQ